jgi:hypothetical protein
MLPTAVQAVPGVQDTELNAPIPIAGFGLGVTLHLLPFQFSISGPDPEE